MDKTFKDYIVETSALNEGAMKGKWRSRAGWGDPLAFEYKDAKILSGVRYDFEDGFTGWIRTVEDQKAGETDNDIKFGPRNTFAEIKQDFKYEKLTLPKDIKDKLGKAILKELGL